MTTWNTNKEYSKKVVHQGMEYVEAHWPLKNVYYKGIEAVIIKVIRGDYWITPVTDSAEFLFVCGTDLDAAKTALLLMAD